MPYVIRDKGTNKVVSISSLETSSHAENLADNHPDLVDFFSVAMPSFTFDVDAKDEYITRRKLEYPKISDQLDLIMKAFKYLKDNGVVIGTDGDSLINACEAVKTKIPKNWKSPK